MAVITPESLIYKNFPASAISCYISNLVSKLSPKDQDNGLPFSSTSSTIIVYPGSAFIIFKLTLLSLPTISQAVG